jgi:hypothetical protein
MGSGMSMGSVTGTNQAREKIKANLSELLQGGDITIQGRDGRSLSPEDFLTKVLPSKKTK